MIKKASLLAGLVFACGLTMGLMVACGQDDGPPAWFHEPGAPDPITVPTEGTESASAALISGSGNGFGSTSRGTNWECHGETCVCDDTIIANHVSEGGDSPDCIDLVAHHCLNGELTCTGGWCVCFKDCWNSPPSCIFASGAIPTGIYNPAPGMGGGVYKRVAKSDRTCQMTSSQWARMGSPAPTSLASPQSENLMATWSGQVCSGVEAGNWTDSQTDGFYRTPGGSIYRKQGNAGVSGLRACTLSWAQYHTTLHDPPYTQLDATGAADFQKRYGVVSGVDPIPCVAADM